jgi:HEAT repeat protein
MASMRLRASFRSVNELEEYLHDGRAEVRAAALNVFAFTADIDVIIQALHDSAVIIRATALSMLRDSWNKRSTEITTDEMLQLDECIQPLLYDNEAVVREHASCCLCLIKSAELYPAVLRATNDDAANVRAAALLIVAGYTDDRHFNSGNVVSNLVGSSAPFANIPVPLTEIRDIYERAMGDAESIVATYARMFFWLTLERKERFKYATEVAQDDSPDMRRMAIEYFALTKCPRRFFPLRAALTDPDKVVRRTAVYALANTEGSLFLDHLLPFFYNPDALIRKAVLSFLRGLGSKVFIPAFLAHVHDKNRNVRMKALEILRELSGQDFDTDIKLWQEWRAKEHTARTVKYSVAIRDAHKHSIKHRQEIVSSTRCGCFYCCRRFAPSEISIWTDNDSRGEGQTALCPKCGIDSVIGDQSGYEITVDFLLLMRGYWFGRKKT